MRKARTADHASVGFLLFVLLVMFGLMLILGCAKQGAQGEAGPVGPRGATGQTGSVGPQGLPGSNGTNGTNGANGAPGLNGTNGINGTIITPVEFCPNFTPAYASSFPEYGFCINNQLWAVYSANGGFMTELPPGQYSSDGINASCTFTVGENCEITND